MRTNKRTTMLRACTAAFALAVGMFTGFAENTLGIDGEYQWVDSLGQTHNAKYLAPATNKWQMKALVASVFADKSIPGQKELIGENYDQNDPTSKDPVECYTYTIYTKKSNSSTYNYGAFHGAYKDYAPLLGEVEYTETTSGKKNQTTTRTANVSPDKDGMTVLLVEMNDGYNPDINTTDVFDEAFKLIKSITVLPTKRQHYMDGDNEFTKGYLVNINKPLGKFFLLVKGDIFQNNYRTAPFWSYFEQISPVYNTGKYDNNNDEITEPVENAYEKMTAIGSTGKFFVDHNCGSVINIGHPMMMFTKESTKNQPSNMLVYIPDGRFYNGGKSGEVKYNYYYIGDKGDFRPYVFIPKLTIKAACPNENIDEYHNATVNVDWTSTIKTITNDKEPERYRLFRSYNNSDWTEVPANEITLVKTKNAVKDETTGYITYSEGSTVEVNVHEMQYHESYKVYYKVFDKLANTEFDETESNVAEVTIPGYEHTNPELTIALEHISNYIFETQQNEYTNNVNFVLQPNDPNGVKNSNMELVNGKKNLKLQLNLYTNVSQSLEQDNFAIDSEKAMPIATVEINETDNDGSTYHYTVVVKDIAGNVNYSGELEATGEEQLHIAGHKNGGEMWAKFTHEFAFGTINHADGNTYSYRLFATNAQNALTQDEKPTNQLNSNIELAAMPLMDHGCGFNDYSLSDIQSDIDHHWAPSVPQFIFTPQSTGDDLNLCTIMSASNRSLLATANKDAQGRWTLKSEYDKVENTNTGGFSSVKAKADPAIMGQQTIMVITRGNNTYGTPKRTMPILPELSVRGLELNYNSDHYEDVLHMNVDIKADAVDNFKSHGYGVWHLENIVILQDKDEIKTISHHKHSSDAAGVEFTYDNGTPVGDHMGLDLWDNAANATVKYTTGQCASGNSTKPYAIWYLARYYAQYHPESTENNVAAVADVNPNQRYVILEATAGSRHDGTGTTGVEDINGESGFSVSGGFGEAILDGNCKVVIVNMQGMVVFDNAIDGEVSVTLPAGLYIANGKKFIVH